MRSLSALSDGGECQPKILSFLIWTAHHTRTGAEPGRSKLHMAADDTNLPTYLLLFIFYFLNLYFVGTVVDQH